MKISFAQQAKVHSSKACEMGDAEKGRTWSALWEAATMGQLLHATKSIYISYAGEYASLWQSMTTGPT